MYLRLKVLLALFLAQLCTAFARDCLVGHVERETLRSGTKNGHFRIISGRRADISEFPYQAAIERFGRQWCGASIITEDVIITAAHCVDAMKELTKIPKSFMSVRVGHSESSTGGTEYGILKIASHERYNEDPAVDDFDIALIKVDRPFNFSETTQPVELADEEPEDGALGYVTGFGRQDPLLRRSTVTRHLMAVEIPVVNREACREIHLVHGNLVTEGMICAGFPSGSKDACKGDSGGPFVVDDKLVGVVAWGMGCGRDGMPGVYTSVPKYREWIDSHLETLEKGTTRRFAGMTHDSFRRAFRPVIA